MVLARRPIKSVHRRRDREPVVTSPDWKAKYAEIRPTYEVCERKLRELVGTVLEYAKIDVVQVEGRVKTVDSFAEKIGRKSGKYTDPLKDMTDLVGLRIIAYYVEDVDAIVEVLSTEFEVIEQHSTNKQDELAPDQFGYASNHVIARVGRSRRALPEWAPYAGIVVEFQVRTTLQHAWAAVNHKLSYKRVEEVPITLQRRLFRLSALFEMADEQFSAIRRAAAELSDVYSDSVKDGNLGIEIDADSMDAYIQNSPKVALILRVLKEQLGVPVASFGVEGQRSALLRTARHLGATTIDEFDQLLPSETGTIRRILTAIEKIAPSTGDAPYENVYHVVVDICVVLHPITEEFYTEVFASDWERLNEIKAELGETETTDSPMT
jgi:putative GTP pyrophosphokinase